jgi:glutathione S-transferase
MLTLYGTPFSPRVNKLRYVLNYLELPYEHVPSSPMSGETRTPEFLKMHPAGKIPVIDDDGFYLFESMAIARYLASKTGSAIYPSELKARALVEQWCDFATAHVEGALLKVFFNRVMVNIPAVGATVDERSLADGLAWLDRYLPIVEQQLTAHNYLVGMDLSLADFVLLTALDPVEAVQVSLDGYPRITAWRKGLVSQPFYTACYPSYSEWLAGVLKAA